MNCVVSWYSANGYRQILSDHICWGRRGTAPFQPVLAGARGTTEMSTHWRGRGKNSTSDSTFRLAYAETQAIIALCANSSCSHGREHRLSAASLFADCYGDRNHPNRGSSLVVAATSNRPAATSFSLIAFLLAAREGRIWPDCFGSEDTRPSPLKPLAPLPRRLALACVRRHRTAGFGSAQTGQTGAISSRR